MRGAVPFVVGLVVLGLASGCSKPQKLTPQEAAIATQTTEQMNEEAAAVPESHYSTYRWMTDEEMVHYRLGYDPTMDPGTRFEVEQAVDNDLAQKGFRRGQPADFVIAFSDVYLDRNRSAPGFPFEGAAIGALEGVNESQIVAFDDMEIYRSPEETFTIVFLDTKTRRLLWRARGKEVLSGGKQSDTKVETAVFRALDDMPVPLP
jgi:Domain of unknown function (DUF4136)